MRNHIIICGIGRNGRQAARRFHKSNQPFVVIEKSMDKVKTLKKQIDFTFLNGDATLDETLLQAGIEHASALIATLPSDSDNLFVVLSARQINSTMKIISRASNDNSDRKLKIAGADNVIMPDRLGGEQMASLVITPDVVEFLDNLALNDVDGVNIEEVKADSLPESDINKTIAELKIRTETGCIVIGMKTSDDKYVINPDVDSKIVLGSKLIILGREDQVMLFNKRFKIEQNMK